MAKQVVDLEEVKRDILEDLFGEIQHLGELEKKVIRKLRVKVRVARRRGASWREVGDALGITRQGAWDRFKND